MNEQLKSASHADLYREVFRGSFERGNEKRMRILDAAIEIIGMHGLEGLTYQKLAEQTDLSPSHIAYYFDSRASLIESCGKYVMLTVHRLNVEHLEKVAGKDWKTQIKALISANVELMQSYPHHFPVWMSCLQSAAWIPSMLEFSRTVRTTGQRRMQAIFQPLFDEWNISPKRQLEISRTAQNIALGWIFESLARGECTPENSNSIGKSVANGIIDYVQGAVGA